MSAGSRPNLIASLVVAAAVVSVVAFGLLKGLFVAAAADAYGYVCQADLWARGSVIVRQPFAEAMAWPNAAASLAPLGYRPHRPAAHGTDIVPVYSPGVPMLMALFKVIGGPRAVYFVVPLLGGVAVWATYLMGRRLAGPLVGASAAALLATSPSFLFEITAPASDVAATAWWALTLALLTFESRAAMLGAGMTTGIAILTRPNLVPLAAVFGLPLVWHLIRRRTDHPAENVPRTAALWYAAGAVPAIIVIAMLNSVLYGSPLRSGYGALEDLYSWGYLSANLARYPRWLVDSQTPLVVLALVAPFVLPASGTFGAARPRMTAIVWLCGIATLFGLYLFYIPFDDWWYVRFIQPMFPPLFVLMVAGLVGLLTPVQRIAPQLAVPLTALLVGLLAWRGVRFAEERGASVVWRAEQRYSEAGEYVKANLPERAAILAVQHSGSVRYYSGRLSVRFDLLQPTDLDLVVQDLRRLGYEPYFVLDEGEEAMFRDRFGKYSALGALDWAPVAAPFDGGVRIYDVSEKMK
jgi:hypothetical protein